MNSEDPANGIRASQLGNDLGLEPLSKILTPERKPPFAVAAFAKLITNMTIVITTMARTFVCTGVSNASRNTSRIRFPVKLARLVPRSGDTIKSRVPTNIDTM